MKKETEKTASGGRRPKEKNPARRPNRTETLKERSNVMSEKENQNERQWSLALSCPPETSAGASGTGRP